MAALVAWMGRSNDGGARRRLDGEEQRRRGKGRRRAATRLRETKCDELSSHGRGSGTGE
jgi:hypothetical protein